MCRAFRFNVILKVYFTLCGTVQSFKLIGPVHSHAADRTKPGEPRDGICARLFVRKFFVHVACMHVKILSMVQSALIYIREENG